MRYIDITEICTRYGISRGTVVKVIGAMQKSGRYPEGWLILLQKKTLVLESAIHDWLRFGNVRNPEPFDPEQTAREIKTLLQI